MALLERDSLLSTLSGLRTEAMAKGGRLVFLEGEAGIGKTSVLRAFRASLPDRTKSLFGSCDPLSTPRPLGPFVDIAPHLDGRFAHLIDTGAPRADLLGAFLTALRLGDAPVVLLDDLHWADEATLDVLRFAGRRIESTRALIVGTYRDDEVGRQHPLRIVVGDLATSPAVRRLRVQPLSVDSVGELASATDLDPVQLHARTGGNPFYVTEVVAGPPEEIPPTVRDAVLARAARLSSKGRRTLEAAAVIGPTVGPGLLANVIDHPATEECLAKGLLQSDGAGYHFRHEVARQAILNATDPGDRQVLHAAVLAALEASAEDERLLAVLAHHAWLADDGDAVLRYAPQAATQAAAVGAHREAVEHLVRTRRFAKRLPERERAAFFGKLGREQFLTAAPDLGTEAYAEAAAIWRRLGDAAEEARVLSESARSLVACTRFGDAEVAVLRAVELAEGFVDGPAKAEGLNALAYLRLQERGTQEAIDLSRRVIEMGGLDPIMVPAVAMAHDTLGTAEILQGDPRGVGDLERGLALALEHGLDRQAARAYLNLASALVEMFRFADAQPYFDSGRAYMLERQLDVQRLYLEGWLAVADVQRGRWSEAGRLASTLHAHPSNSAIGRIVALVALGRLRTRRGDPDAWVALDEAASLIDPTGTMESTGPVRAARAELAAQDGDASRSAAEAAAAFGLAFRTGHAWLLGELAWWLGQAGEPVDVPSVAAEPWRLQLEGRWRDATDAWRNLDCPYEAARALLASSEIADVEEARVAFDALGARPGVALAARRLRQLGVRSIPRGRRPSTRENPAGLTTRELEVLRLVIAGLQNHQIATRLFLSSRTVDHHVAAVIAKLGVSRRGEVAAAAARAGIDTHVG